MQPYERTKSNYPGRTTQGAIRGFSMVDEPSENLSNFIGYFRNTDPTVLPPNCLTFPSINCFIPNKDKIVPRLGTELLGQTYSAYQNWPIVGHKKRFATMGGYEIEVRVVKTDDADLKDMIEVFYPNPATGIYEWYRITQTVNPFITGPHRYYFDDWFDTNLNPAKSLNLSRLVWVNGLPNIFSWTGGIAPIVSIVPNTSISTTAGVTWISLGFPAYSSSIVVNGLSYAVTGGWDTDTLLLSDTTSILVNNVAFSQIESNAIDPSGFLIFSGLSGNFQTGETITGGTSGAIGIITDMNSSAGSLILTVPIGNPLFVVGETITGGTSGATAQVVSYVFSPSPSFDMCRNNKNYMFYGNWNSRKLFMSNGFNHDSTTEITTVQAGQDDIVLSSSAYTGSGSHVYRVTIDSVNPNINTFTVSGAGLLDDGFFNTAGYSGADGVTNVYKVVMVADFTITYTDTLNVYTPGEVVEGATSKAKGIYVAEVVNDPMGTTLRAGLVIQSGVFIPGEVVTGVDSGASNTTIETLYQDWVQYYVNDVATILSGGIASGLTVPIIDFAGGLLTLTDGLTINFGNYFGHLIGNSYMLTINQGGNDTFVWQIDDGAISAPVAITGGDQTLSDGVQIKFVSITGHTLGDTWSITVNQAVEHAWANFYYTLPVRKPGEGYIYQLPSNFWTMAPQESEMYVNTKFGKWSYIETILSADLQSETVSLTPLKQVSSSKVIFPYMIGYMDDDLIYVTENKTLDMIGRKELLQLPQTSNLSQPVALDFQDATFEDGSMEYLNKQLYMTSPKQSLMLVYDNQPQNKYWQPPQVIPENGILSIIENTLITHSNLRNQSFKLFTGTSGDNNGNYIVRARSPYLSMGNRWRRKNSNMSFTEGYVTGAPPMKMKVYLGINGCAGIFPHDIQPVICISPDFAPFGEGNFGSHQNGSDRFNQDSHFNEIYQQFSPILEYYFAALELECTATNHSYSWLSFGLNDVVANTGNNQFKNEEIISME